MLLSFYVNSRMSYINKAIRDDDSSIEEQNSEKNVEKKFQNYILFEMFTDFFSLQSCYFVPLYCVLKSNLFKFL